MLRRRAGRRPGGPGARQHPAARRAGGGVEPGRRRRRQPGHLGHRGGGGLGGPHPRRPRELAAVRVDGAAVGGRGAGGRICLRRDPRRAPARRDRADPPVLRDRPAARSGRRRSEAEGAPGLSRRGGHRGADRVAGRPGGPDPRLAADAGIAAQRGRGGPPRGGHEPHGGRLRGSCRRGWAHSRGCRLGAARDRRRRLGARRRDRRSADRPALARPVAAGDRRPARGRGRGHPHQRGGAVRCPGAGVGARHRGADREAVARAPDRGGLVPRLHGARAARGHATSTATRCSGTGCWPRESSAATGAWWTRGCAAWSTRWTTRARSTAWCSRSSPWPRATTSRGPAPDPTASSPARARAGASACERCVPPGSAGDAVLTSTSTWWTR